MRILFTIVILSAFFSCKKEVRETPHPPEIEVDTAGLTPVQKRPYQNIQDGRTFNKTNRKDVPGNVILLDFDGALVSNTNWNLYGDLHLDYSGLTMLEQGMIEDSVAKYFLYFPVTITRSEAVYNSADLDKRERIVLTESWEWYGKAGGVAYINSWDWHDETPAFIFTPLLGYNTKTIARAAAHEIGHTLGLRHQSKWEGSILVNEYNYGTAYMAPIMGVAYYSAVAEWYTGYNSYHHKQYDGRLMEQVLGGRYDGTGTFKPYQP